MFLVVLFLEEQVGAGGEEGVRRVLAGDHRNSVAILGGETPEHVEDLRRLTHRLADIAQRVGELLQLAGVGLDIHVALDQALELGLQVNSAVKLMVPELIMDRVPDGVGRSLGGTNNGTHILGDSIVQPAKDTLIYHGPLGITAVGWSRSKRKMGADAKLSNERIEETPPLGVVRFVDVELDRDVGLDVDGLQNVGGKGGCSGSIGLAGISGGGIGLDIRDIGVEEGVRVHEIGSQHGRWAAERKNDATRDAARNDRGEKARGSTRAL
jgi:hypothetical protein